MLCAAVKDIIGNYEGVFIAAQTVQVAWLICIALGRQLGQI